MIGSFYNSEEIMHMFGSMHKSTQVSRACYIPNPSNIYLGKNVQINSFSSIVCSGNATVVIGDHTMIGSNVFIYASKNIHIGNDCAIGAGAKLYTEVQDFGIKQRLGKKHDAFDVRKVKASKITIGDNCGVGASCILLPGSHLNEYASLGAGTVWNKTLDAGMIVYSNQKIIIKNKKLLNE